MHKVLTIMLLVWTRLLTNNRGEVENTGEAGESAEQQALEAALSTDHGIGAQPAAGAGEPAADGKDAAAAGAADKDKKPDEDPEFEVDTGNKEKPNLQKIKLSALRQGYMQGQDYTQKLQAFNEEKAKHEDLLQVANAIKGDKDLSDLIIRMMEKAVGKEGYNRDFITKQLQSLDAKADAAAAKIEGQQDDLEDILKDLDPESPTAKMLRRTYAANQAALKQIDALQKRLESHEGKVQQQETQAQKAAQDKAANDAKKVLNDTLASLVDPNNKDRLSFDSDDEKKLWWERTLAHLRENPRQYKDANDFAAAIQDAGKKTFTALNTVYEARLAKYLKSKKGTVPTGGVQGGQQVSSGTVLDMSDPEKLQAGLEAALTNEAAAK